MWERLPACTARHSAEVTAQARPAELQAASAFTAIIVLISKILQDRGDNRDYQPDYAPHPCRRKGEVWDQPAENQHYALAQ